MLAQETDIDRLVRSVSSKKTFEEQQDRHIKVNDSLDNLKQYKKEFVFINAMEAEAKAQKNLKLEAVVLISKGNFYVGTGNYTNALEVFNSCLKLYAEIKEHSGLSTVHANMGNVYFYLRDFDKSLYYYKQAVSDLKKSEKKNTPSRLANCYNSLGSIYCSKRDYVYGRTYFNLAYNIWSKTGDSISLAYLNNNFANIFYTQGNMDSAYYYFNKALGIKLRHGDSYDQADAYNNLGDFYMKNDDPKKGISMALNSLRRLDTTIYSRQLVTAYHVLVEGYNELKDYRNELKYYKKYKAAVDSADVQGQKSELVRKELKQEFDRIHLTDSIKAVEEIKLKDATISSKKQQSYFLIFILFLTIIVLGLIYSRFKLTKKQKLIIEQKNKEITDSINYAKKIQSSSLPSEKFIIREIKRLKDEPKG